LSDIEDDDDDDGSDADSNVADDDDDDDDDNDNEDGVSSRKCESPPKKRVRFGDTVEIEKPKVTVSGL